MRCVECKGAVVQIGDGVWYCKECDRIIVDKKGLMEEKKR